MIRPHRPRFGCLRSIRAGWVVLLLGCAGPTSSAPHVDVTPVAAPPSSPASRQPGAALKRHSLSYGGTGSALQRDLRKIYVVAVARTGDTGLVDTPFGDREVRVGVDGALAAGIVEGGGTAKVTVGVDESLRQEKLRAEPAPTGYTLTTRAQIIASLQKSRCFTVVERESINDIVRELEFGESKWVSHNGKTAARAGLRQVAFIVNGSLEINEAGLEASRTTPNNWTGNEGFPEDSSQREPFCYRLRMYSTETGVIVVVGEGYGRTVLRAIENAVRSLAREVIRHHKSNLQVDN